MSRKQKSFSMAEMLIALLAVSIIVSATIPTFTRKASTNEQVFNFTPSGADGRGGYAFPNDAGSVIIGYNRVINPSSSENNSVLNSNLTNNNLTLVKNYRGGSNNSVRSGDSTNSHLMFYNKNTTDANKIYNVGRMYFDETNLGIGTNTLAYLDVGGRPTSGYKSATIDYGRRNTAYGQLALFSFTAGDYSRGTDNTGVGYDALTGNTTNDSYTQAAFVNLIPSSTYGNNFGIQPSSGNTGMGSFSLTHNGTRSYNTAVGRSALYMHNKPQNGTVISNANTAVGFSAMLGGHSDAGTADNDYINTQIIGYSSTPASDTHTVFGTGSANVAVGAFALSRARLSTSNIAIGPFAMYNYDGYVNSSSDVYYDFGNIAIGEKALARQSKGYGNVVIGHEAAQRIDSSNFIDNIIIGRRAYHDEKNASVNTNDIKQNVIVGSQILSLEKSGSNTNKTKASNNVFLGYKAVNDSKATDVQNSIVIGANATNFSSDVTTSDTTVSNKFILGTAGYRLFDGTIPTSASSGGSLKINVGNYTANGAVQMGSDSGSDGNVSMPDNLYVGVNKPSDSGTWKANNEGSKTNQYGEIHVGNRIAVGYAQGNSDIAIDISAAYNSRDRSSKSNNTAYIALGGTSSNRNIELKGDGTVYIAGDLTVKGSIKGTTTGNLTRCTSYCSSYATSDARLKNILSESTAGLKEINALEVKNFTFKKDEKKTPHVGVIAQSLQKIFPNAVTKDDEGYLMIRTEDIFYAMVNSIKELYRDFQDLTAKITGLDKRLSELEKQNQQLTEQNKAFEARLKKLEAKTN